MIPLSEAMMLGGVIKRHVPHGGYGNNGCAMQLAMAALGKDCASLGALTETTFIYPWVSTTGNICPGCTAQMSILQVILHLNDFHKWPLERIADWVRSIEPPQPCEVEQQSEREVLAYA